jgi:GTP cyclohydrolase I
VKVPVMLLCPCSKAISKFNAHNQRSIITVDALLKGDLLIDELIKTIEKNGSCEIYPVLKRPDEKYVTEKSYENPKFVEDAVRDTALSIKKNKNILSFTVECESFESIHNHNAYARYTSIDDVKHN